MPRDDRTRRKRQFAEKIDPKIEDAAKLPISGPDAKIILSLSQLVELEQMAMRPTTTWKMIAAYFRFSEPTLKHIFDRQPEAREAYERGVALGKYAIGDALLKNAVTNQYFPAQKFLATNFLGMTDNGNRRDSDLFMPYEDIIAEIYNRGKKVLERAAIEEGKLIDGTATIVHDPKTTG